MDFSSYPTHWGIFFTPTVHNKAEGPTEPKNNKLPPNFVIVITGAGKGVGYQIAVAFAQAGAMGIVISSRTQTDLDKLTAEIESINPKLKVIAQICDTTRDEDVQRLADVTRNSFGRVDVVVANAGVVSRHIISATGQRILPNGIVDDPDADLVLQINLLGTYRTAKAFLPLLQATKDSVQGFVAISSIAGNFSDSQFGPVAYNLSKTAVTRLVETLHHEYLEQDGVQAFAVHPGAVLTPMTVNHHETQLGSVWKDVLTDDPGLCGGFLTWLTKERRPWLSGRYLASAWDVDELQAKKDEIVEKDLLTFKMGV